MFQAFRVEKVGYLWIPEFVWPGGDISQTRHIKDWFGASESFWLFFGAKLGLAKDFGKKLKFLKMSKTQLKISKINFEDIFECEIGSTCD